MFLHVPGGSSVCIHAVATAPQFQRRGIALSLLKEYLTRLERDGTVERVLLICHEDLVSLYEKAGFELVGRSSVVHGAREWFEMRRILRSSTQASVPSIPQNVLAAALSVRPNAHPRATLLPSVAGVNELVIEADGDRINKYPIVCVQDGCGGLILQAKTARLRQAPSVQLEPPMHPPPAKLPPLPPLGESASWWLVSPSPMIFDNIAFSRPLPTPQPNALEPRIKLLACAICDLGPIGWSLEGGSEFWVYCGRVGYQM
ncbi:hypothetical protein BS47DRAFT_1330774 [Hydnum rufescens UP504]|uniref:N-acetyltransferase domain-containing protein n=1 Tax=Hydnum rufescens UP504 TaxID=1448309 RepID=A0A9P6ATF5_9AGAM|nr:hypothetical protein BS47DRAFT_1330774 [Hydnum rufescens UP504]